LKDSKRLRIFVAGHEGLVGSAIAQNLHSNTNYQVIVATKSELNLLNQSDVLDFFQNEHIDEIYIAAARVGGIHANDSYPADFIYQNLMIQSNIIHSAHINNINKLLFLGSSCIYPVHAEQPMQEDSLLTGPLEITNQSYAVAKIAGIEMCRSYNLQHSRDYRCLMPTNLYGPNDHFHSENSHVIPALISKFYTAVNSNQTEVRVWGSGDPIREFLHVNDLVDACIYCMQLSKESYSRVLDTSMPHINIGSGTEVSIKKLAAMLAEISGFKGDIIFDTSMPDGSPRKFLNSSLIKKLGWEPSISLENGLKETYEWFSATQDVLRSQAK
jgi:GDP-L-fucose synthase